MGAPVILDYFGWLSSRTGDRHESYSRLLHALHRRPFEWYIPHDDNRGEDGMELREIYTDTFRIFGEDLWPAGKASVLEVLVALSGRLEDDTEVSAADWFWKLIENLGLQHYQNRHLHRHAELEVDHILTVLLERQFGPDGVGSLFPLRNPQHDQRQVEIWYQMQAYLLESEYVNNWP